MKSGSVLSRCSGSHLSDATFINSCQRLSFGPSCKFSSALFKTTTCSTKLSSFIDSSIIPFRFIEPPLLYPTSAVTITLDFESSILSFKETALKPENTTVWMAPILAQASIVIGSSGTIGR